MPTKWLLEPKASAPSSAAGASREQHRQQMPRRGTQKESKEPRASGWNADGVYYREQS